MAPLAPAGRFEFRAGPEIAALVDGEVVAGPIDDPDVIVEGDPDGIYSLFVDKCSDQSHDPGRPGPPRRTARGGPAAGRDARGEVGRILSPRSGACLPGADSDLRPRCSMSVETVDPDPSLPWIAAALGRRPRYRTQGRPTPRWVRRNLSSASATASCCSRKGA